jgi:hypothetical protein
MKWLKGPLGIAALVVLCSVGSAVAAKKLITGKDIKDHSITGREIKRKSIPVSALRTQVAGPKGEAGEAGPPGDPGLTGEPGEAGASAFTEAFSFEGPVAATIAPSSEWQFIGSETIVVFGGDRGQITSSVTIGAASEIDDPGDFTLGICFDEGEGVEPFSEAGAGLSPTLPAGQTVTVPLVTAFGLTGEPDEGLEAEVGPCVLNETAIDLDENDRFQGAVLIAAA